MATFLSDQHMTLSQALEYQRYDGSLAFVRDLEKESTLMQMMPWFPTSHGSVHKGVKATALPKGNFGAINKHVPSGYGATTEYTESVGVYELASFVDTRILQGRSVEQADTIRAANDRLQLMGFMQGLANEIITNPGTDADSVKGLIPRRSAVDGKYTIDMGGTGSDLGSILFIRFGEDGVSCRYPSAGAPNFSLEDLGTVQAIETDGDGAFVGTYPAKETLARCYYTVDVANDDALIRLCNVPIKTKFTDTNIDTLIDVINVNIRKQRDRYVAFAPVNIISQFQKYANSKNNAYFAYKDIQGMGMPPYFYGIPFFADDFMTATEAQVS